jgi:hypothetical protein
MRMTPMSTLLQSAVGGALDAVVQQTLTQSPLWRIMLLGCYVGLVYHKLRDAFWLKRAKVRRLHKGPQRSFRSDRVTADKFTVASHNATEVL